MSEKDKKNFDSNAVPFFACYLKEQFCEDLSEEEMDEVYVGLSRVKEIVVNLKFSSDNEDSSGKVHRLTKKYPSDADEVFTG